jgi:hypothetical protein
VPSEAERRARGRMVKYLRLTRSPEPEEARRAARKVLDSIRDLRPTLWRWPEGTLVHYTSAEGWQAGQALQKGKTSNVLLIPAADVVEFRYLDRSVLGARIGRSMALLPADCAEPLW